MTAKSEEIKKWEEAEADRSASEAQKISTENLIADEKNMNRYISPPEETCYYLEYSYFLLGDIKGKTVLDYGCGDGDNSLILAKRGANVIGVDISPELLEIAEKRMLANGITTNTKFLVASAHDLPIPDESIDIVFGIAILHHLDLQESSREIFRVLKKGGRAIFQEPVRNSNFVNFVRNLIPYQQPDISPFERPLKDFELKEFAKDFSNYKSRAFSLPFVNLLDVLPISKSHYHRAIKLDRKILNKVPSLGYYATHYVIEMTK